MDSLTRQLEEGLSHHRAGRLGEAEAIYRRILAQHPDDSNAVQLLGAIAGQRGRLEEAIALTERAIAINPNVAEYHANLAGFYLSQKKIDHAIAAGRRAVGANAECVEGYFNLGLAFAEKSRFDDALAAFAQSSARRPNWPELHNSIGLSLRSKGEITSAITSFRRAVSLRTDYAEAHWNLALTLLLNSNLPEGWREFEWRLKIPEIVAPRDFSQPGWNGSDLRGKTILVHDEQGFGDAIQFARYLPMVAERGGNIILGCARETAGLFQTMPAIGRVLTSGQPMPGFDAHVPLLSLPLMFGTTLSTIPAKVPYLTAPAEGVENWRRKIGAGDGRVRVGLAWAGRPTHKNDPRRSMRLDQFAPLANIKSVCFYSLQKGEAARQSASPPAGMQWVDWTDDLHDFADTAGLVANLDLVICVDTAVAHLAGAMGKPVWVLLPFVPDWRWLLNRDDSPWYPTMRLFRQSTAGDWDGVIQRVGTALEEYWPTSSMD